MSAGRHICAIRKGSVAIKPHNQRIPVLVPTGVSASSTCAYASVDILVNVCSCGETQGRRRGEGHLKTLRLYNPRATYITFPTLHFPCKEQWNLNGSIQSSAPAGIIWLRTQSRGKKIREFWRKDIKIDRICFLMWGWNGRVCVWGGGQIVPGYGKTVCIFFYRAK